MTQVDVVCLCRRTDLKKTFGPHVAAMAPWLRLHRPQEVEDPTRIEFALAWKPASGDFAPYPALKLVTSVGAGADAILACNDLAPEIVVSRVMDPEQAAQMAGFALWHVIGHDRRLLEYPALQSAQQWLQLTKAPPSRFPVGLLGYGLMGRALAHLLVELGYPVIAWARSEHTDTPQGVEVLCGDDGLHRIAREARALVNMLPLTHATRGILGHALFDAMRDDALLVQIGRGEHLVERELIAALDHEAIAGAALDVFEHEPLEPEHPFWSHPKIRVTPHVASEPDDRTVARWLVEEVERVRHARPAAGAIDRVRGY